VLFDTIPIEVNNQYLMFLDLDNNSSTGGSPSSLGFDTGFQGAELVTRVVVTFIPPPAITIASAGFRVVTPTVWKFQSGNLVEVSDSGIGAQVRTVREAETGQELFDVVSIHMPNSVRGPATAQARIQAIAEQLFAPGELDRLPDSPLSGGVPLFLVHPEFPLCGVDPAEVPQGSAASVEANGLIPGETAKVFLGDELVSTGLIDEQGNADISFAVPFTAPTGPRLVTVGVMGTALTADCSVEVTEALPLDIDIKPASYPNCINKDNKGRVPVAVLGLPGLDVKDIDPATIEVNDTPTPGSGVSPVRTSSNKDVSDPPDGIKDFVAHFNTSDLKDAGLLATGNEWFITGRLKDGTPFVGGPDEVQIAGDPASSCQ
jgi:hypothetical protein